MKRMLDRQGATLRDMSRQELLEAIAGLQHLEVKLAFGGGMDYALYSEFERKEDVPAYRAHPLHQEAKSHFHHFLDTRVSADYEV